MGYGDEIMAAGEAEVLFRADPSRPVVILDKRGEPRWHEVWNHNPAIATPVHYHRDQPHQILRNGEGCRPYIRYPFTADTGIRFTDWRARDYVGRLYLNDDEMSFGRQLRQRIGSFLVIEPDVKPSTTPNKAWGVDRFAEVVAARPDLTFVRVHGEECAPFAPVHNFKMPSFREACGVLAASEGFIGTEGGLHHAAAALGKPAVVVFGGFISPMTTGYATHINVCDTGTGSPCGRWMRCEHCRQAMAGISVQQVVEALDLMVQGRQEQAS